MKDKPELSDGHARIANEIMDALACTYMSSYESQFIWYLFRKTYGWGKKEDTIALSQFSAGTGMHRSHVSRTKKKLLSRRIVTQTGNKIAFNKYHNQWQKLPKQVTDKYNITQTGNNGGGTQTGKWVLPKQVNTVVPKQVPTKDNITKDNITKEIPTVTIIPIFSPLNFMPDFVVSPNGDEAPVEPKKKKKPQPFNYQDYNELVRLMKKTCYFTTLENGRTAQDNYARHILLKLLKILTKEHGWPEQEAIDNIRANMEEFCVLVQKARARDGFLFKHLSSLKAIYFKMPEIFEITKTEIVSRKATTHLSL